MHACVIFKYATLQYMPMMQEWHMLWEQSAVLRLDFMSLCVGTHVWYYKSGQEPKVGELTGPRGEMTTIILLNGQRVTTNIIFNKRYPTGKAPFLH